MLLNAVFKRQLTKQFITYKFGEMSALYTLLYMEDWSNCG